MNDTLRRWLESGKPRDENAPSSSSAQSSDPKKKRANPVVAKVLGYRQFFGRLEGLEPPLSPGAVALWCWLWTCERKGLSRCTVRRLAKRFRVGTATVERWLRALRQAGFVQTVRRGKPGRSASVVRVRVKPKPPHSDTRSDLR